MTSQKYLNYFLPTIKQGTASILVWDCFCYAREDLQKINELWENMQELFKWSAFQKYSAFNGMATIPQTADINPIKLLCVPWMSCKNSGLIFFPSFGIISKSNVQNCSSCAMYETKILWLTNRKFQYIQYIIWAAMLKFGQRVKFKNLLSNTVSTILKNYTTNVKECLSV